MDSPRALLLLSILLSLCFLARSQHNTSCDPKDLLALKAFLNSLDSSTLLWHNASSDCCQWPDVVCELVGDGTNSSAKRVVELNLGNRGLNGSISDSVSGLDQLRVLNLSLNSFAGVVPPELFNLQHLQVLDLSSNQLNGKLDQGIANLSSIVHLDLSFNGLSGVIPDVFEKLRKLESFSARACRFSGSLPPSLSALSMLRLLQLTNNSLNGSIDLDFGKLPRLTSLHLASNRFHGGIPESLSSCKNLTNINLARNKLSGEIPRSFERLQALSVLSLSNNSFSNISSALTTLAKCQNLSILVLTLGFHNEIMPSEGIHGGFQKMSVLVIPYCGLRGSIPSWVGSLPKLAMLDLSWNYLSGAIPPWLGSLDHLFYLDLSNNSFTSSIPKSLTQLKSLTLGNGASYESFGAEFPLYTRRNNSPDQSLQYNQFFNFPPKLDLSHNRLSGGLYKEFGNLKRLHWLDLSHNNLSGSIPNEFSGMRSIEMLDLSSNNLSGPIPSSLTKLSFLSKFNVANNHLQGLIPTGGQFLTFPNASFEGNPDLCGLYFSPCTSSGNDSGSSPTLVVEEVGSQIDILGLPFIIGVSVGFLFSVILCMKLMK